MTRVPSPVPHRSIAIAPRRPARRPRALALLTGTLLAAGALGSAGAGAEPAIGGSSDADYGNGCVVTAGDKARTMDSLRSHCTAEQQDAIYRGAGAGAAPAGVTDGWVVRPAYGTGLAPLAWIGKTFATGPDGGTLTNRLSVGVDAWPATIYRTASIADGAPAWALDYAPSPTPQVYDEIREIVPGVWLGYSWWRQADQDVLLLAFALTD